MTKSDPTAMIRTSWEIIITISLWIRACEFSIVFFVGWFNTLSFSCTDQIHPSNIINNFSIHTFMFEATRSCRLNNISTVYDRWNSAFTIWTEENSFMIDTPFPITIIVFRIFTMSITPSISCITIIISCKLLFAAISETVTIR